MSERWKDIDGFDGYQVSDKGRVRSFWERHHKAKGYGAEWRISENPSILSASDDGNGYLKVALTNHRDGCRYCRKIHRLVAEAFIPHSSSDDTVDHIISGKKGKLDNSVENLRWVSRAENIRKAYRDGMCDDRIRRQRRPVVATDTWLGEEVYFPSASEAAKFLGVDTSTVIHAIGRDLMVSKRYIFEHADREEILLHVGEDY